MRLYSDYCVCVPLLLECRPLASLNSQSMEAGTSSLKSDVGLNLQPNITTFLLLTREFHLSICLVCYRSIELHRQLRLVQPGVDMCLQVFKTITPVLLCNPQQSYCLSLR